MVKRRRLMQDHNLVSEYQEVEWIESTGSQYINLDLLPTNLDNEPIVFYLDFESKEEVFPALPVFYFGASRNSSNYWGFGRDSNFFADCNCSLYFNFYDKNRHLFVFDMANSNVRIDNISMPLPTTSLGSINKNCILFGRMSGVPELFSRMRVYKVRVDFGNTTYAELIPCYSKANGEIGLFDIIRERFFFNDGSGVFNKGADI